jgi:hypothetical protein
MFDDFNREPDFINELGVKWWKDDSTTKYAQSPDTFGTRLEAFCFLVEEANGYRTRLLVSKDREVLEEDTMLEGMGVKIDLRKLLKRNQDIAKESKKK